MLDFVQLDLYTTKDSDYIMIIMLNIMWKRVFNNKHII